MEKEKFDIEYPSNQSMKQQIQEIVSIGVTKPKSFPAYLKEMYQNVGFRYLFRDSTELLFMVMLMLCALLVGIQAIESQIHEKDMYSFIFILSPVFYFIIAILFLVNASNRNTFEVEMTCKYHVFQLAAFRMLVFSVVALLGNSLIVIVLAIILPSINVISALLISISSLSIFSTIFLYVIQKKKGRYSSYVVLACWIGLNALPAIFNQDVYSLFLSKIPIYVYLIVLAVSGSIYVNRLKKFITFRNVEEAL